MTELPPFLQTTTPGIGPKVYPNRRYLDPDDILYNYDRGVVSLFRIPLVGKVRFYEREELVLLSVPKLQALADSLGVNSSTERQDLLIKAILNAQQIPVVFASPSPAYAAQELTTGRKEGSPMSSNVRYPILSVQRLGVSSRSESLTRHLYRKITWVGSNQAVIQGFKPSGILLTYQIECLATLQTHMNLMDSWIQRVWNLPVVHMDVDLGEPWGTRTVHVMKDSGYADQTEYEMDSSVAEKMVRHIYTVQVEGWLPTPVWTTPTVLKFQMGWYDMDTGVLLEGEGEKLLLPSVVESPQGGDVQNIGRTGLYQAGSSFTVGELLSISGTFIPTPVDGSLSVIGMVSKASGHRFDITTFGFVTVPSHGLGISGTPVYLSQTTPGQATSTRPVGGYIQKVGEVFDADTILLNIQVGVFE